MAEYSVQKVSLSGVEITKEAVTSEDQFINDGRTCLVVYNGDSSDITVTIDSVVPCNYGYDHDVVVTVPAGKEIWVGPFPCGRFNDGNGKVTVSYSGTTSVTAAAVKI